jgi:hypothetical protein
MTGEQAETMLKMLSEHFKEPVMPVGRYCAALRIYAGAIDDRARRTKEKRDVEHADQVHHVFLQVQKSNLLYRLIYLGEELRPVACPEHQGRWSGCVSRDESCVCASGSNITGWLPVGGKP